MRKEIEKLFYQFGNLQDNYVDMDGVNEKREELNNYLEEQKGKPITEELGFDMEEYIMELCAENEKQGFIYGFEYATRLLMCQKEAVSLVEKGV